MKELIKEVLLSRDIRRQSNLFGNSEISKTGRDIASKKKHGDKPGFIVDNDYHMIGKAGKNQEIWMMANSAAGRDFEHDSYYDISLVAINAKTNVVTYYLGATGQYRPKNHSFTLSDLALAKNEKAKDTDFDPNFKSEDFYQHLIDKHDFILKGTEQTPGSAGTWDKLANKHAKSVGTFTQLDGKNEPFDLKRDDEDDENDAEDIYFDDDNPDFNPDVADEKQNRELIAHSKKKRSPKFHSRLNYTMLSNYSLGQRAKHGDQLAKEEQRRRIKTKYGQNEEFAGVPANSVSGGGVDLGQNGFFKGKVKTKPSWKILKRKPLTHK